MAELHGTLQDRLKLIFDDAGGSDTLVDLLRDFDFESSRDLADAIVLGMTRDTELLAELSAAVGYMMNAAIDLETGAPKRTALNTLNGGIKRFKAVLGSMNSHSDQGGQWKTGR